MAAGTYLRVAIHPSRGGPCATTSTHAAPPMWRNVDEDFDRVAKEMAAATDQWKKLDDHAQLMDPTAKPPDSNGHPYIPGAAMLESKTINAGTIFVGEKGSGRWCEKREAVTVLVRNKTNKTFYKITDVRSSVATVRDRAA